MQINIKQSPPLYLSLFFVVVGLLIWLFSPSADKHQKPPTPVIAVETTTITPKKYQVMISSFGRIEPRTQGHLVAQVSGQIIEVSPNFCDGCFFGEREVLVTIDPRDYEIQVDIAAAELANAEVNYAEQQVLAEQAVKDRKTLRKKGAASDFALHIPQLAAAKSQIGAARAKLNKAKLDVERTQIRAPYYGRILTKSVDIGEVISANTSLASMYSTDLVEVTLPIKDSELPLINLPEPATSGKNGTSTRAKIINKLGDSEQSWQAVLVRTSGAIDEQSQQLSVTAQIDHPYAGDKDGRRPLKIGQYVTAEIEGKTIPDAIVIPNAAIYQGSYVYLYKDGLLQRREVEIAWQNSTEALIRKGISAGEQLVLTPLGRVSSGTPVKKLGATKRKQGADTDKPYKAKSRKQEHQQ
jgi:RND family efflux transporter MFP subunit